MKILMVCLGNICRSPMAEGIIRYKLGERGLQATVDSAGTGGWHVGESPDHRAILTMKEHGIDISNLIARQFKKNDLDQFDLILAMDKTNYSDIIELTNDAKYKQKVRLILDYTTKHKGSSVPDPWYGGQEGFESVYQMLDEACESIIKEHFHEKR